MSHELKQIAAATTVEVAVQGKDDVYYAPLTKKAAKALVQGNEDQFGVIVYDDGSVIIDRRSM